MTLFPLILPFAVLSLCAMHDATSFKIPNRYVAVLLAGWLPMVWLTDMSWQVAGVSAAMAGLILLVGFALFALGLLGAGDVKLLAATALWVAPAQMPTFLLATTFLGGVLSLVLLRLRSMPLPGFAMQAGWLVQLHERERVMPYGVAIAGGAMIALWMGATV